MTISEQKTFKLLAIKEFQIMKAVEKNSNTDKLEETYLKLMSAGNVTNLGMLMLQWMMKIQKDLEFGLKTLKNIDQREYFADKNCIKTLIVLLII